MHTKQKGNISELIVAQKCIDNGWNVAFPFGENQKYDLIIEKSGVCKRVQVKSLMPRDGALKINCRSSNNWSVYHYSKSDFEILAAVDLSCNEVYFIDSETMHRSQFNIRIVKSKNSQEKSINLAENFRIIPI